MSQFILEVIRILNIHTTINLHGEEILKEKENSII
jgi:hypothetical protein